MNDQVTQLLTYFQQTIASLYTPSLPVFLAKRPASNGRQREGGFWEGQNISAGAFTLSCNEDEIVDKITTFENVLRTFPILVEYVKRATNAATVSNPNSAPAEVLEDPDVRQKRTALENALYVQTATSVPNLFDVRVKPGRSYETTSDNKSVIVSPVTFYCTCWSKRPGT